MLALHLKAAQPTVTAAECDATEEASTYREAALFLDECKSDLALARVALLAKVNAARRAQLESGQACPSIPVPTSDGARVLVVYRESYKGIDGENIPALRAAFGERYPLYCEERETVKLRKGVSVAQLQDVLGDEGYAALSALLDVTSDVCCRKGAPALAAKLYAKGQTEEADDLLTLVQACMSAPQVRAK